MKKIAITGASGFIGSFLVEEALQKGFDTYAILRSSSSKKYLSDNRINFIDFNLADKIAMIDQFKELKSRGVVFDYFVHNAGATKVVKKKDYLKVNFLYTKNLIEALIESGCTPKKFIYMSSLAAYGPGDPISGLPIKESDTPKPLSLYGKSKLASEKYIRSLSNFPFIIIRPTGVIGPRDTEFISFYKTINRSIEPYIGSPNQLLTFIYIKDLIQLIFNAIDSDVINKSYFATDGINYTGKELAAVVKEVLSKKTIRIVFPKMVIKPIAFFSEHVSRMFGKPSILNTEKYKEFTALNWLCDSTPAETELNFKAEYDLKKGVEESVIWFKENKQL
ncbi:MAG: NAD(P)-dependent oxidoreductase [Bacteroidetes bacterium]|nr:MAG: NAD(P)-dependent oxidoreductase [Bacteroidota bacterium]